jgi:hypothetical protein
MTLPSRSSTTGFVHPPVLLSTTTWDHSLLQNAILLYDPSVTLETLEKKINETISRKQSLLLIY